MRLIPATELTGYDYERSHRVHLLAFWPDPESKALREHCDIMRQRRNECCLQSAREIEALYPQFRTEQALEYAKDSGVLYKSGIMQALHELGLCDGIYTSLYHYLFGWNPRGIVLHSPEYRPVRDVLATAKAAGAVVVFAHPTVYQSMPLVRELVKEGMIDGIEVEHPATARRTKPSAPPSVNSTVSSTPAAAISMEPTTAIQTLWGPASHPMTRSPALKSWPTRESADATLGELFRASGTGHSIPRPAACGSRVPPSGHLRRKTPARLHRVAKLPERTCFKCQLLTFLAAYSILLCKRHHGRVKPWDLKKRGYFAMSKSFSFPNVGTCSKQTNIVLNDDHTIESIEVVGGCNGNLKGISRLLKGMKAEDAIARMEGTTCGPRPTSCPDQIAKNLKKALAEM